jgi:hypothetical protein
MRTKTVIVKGSFLETEEEDCVDELKEAIEEEKGIETVEIVDSLDEAVTILDEIAELIFLSCENGLWERIVELGKKYPEIAITFLIDVDEIPEKAIVILSRPWLLGDIVSEERLDFIFRRRK